MDHDDSNPPAEPVDLRNASPQEIPTINQLVAYNMTKARRSRDWTQQEVADRLERYTGRPWSKASISAAERSWQGGRSRKFDANELVALSVIFEMPLAYFFLPPEDGSARAVYMAQPEDRNAANPQIAGIPLLLKRALMDRSPSRQDYDFFTRAPMAVRNYVGEEWHPPVFLSPEMVENLRSIPVETLTGAGHAHDDGSESQPVGTSQDVELVSPADLTNAIGEYVRKAIMDQSAEIAMGIIHGLGKQGMLVIQPVAEPQPLSGSVAGVDRSFTDEEVEQQPKPQES
ncbi:helix-turn-helix domain-containing protein [Streptomyces sp. NBC_00151]|uniref:helix-turn-helix domain-containing protein n=1 Tax=Streptomyces sp. NBC_00151 TaxID=2975669 RepID=UPI002DDBE7B9|nr:helix-turn-helix transcriptional regulator [Streptomyces sp. NBC_00151]WRZ40398.1 helix-turn-helix domain-containing protein [Streptomyces sp. NBC_00151]